MRLCRLEDPGLWERRAVGHPSFYRLSSWKRQDRVRTFRRGREGSSDERSLSVVERLAEEAHVTRRLLQDLGVPFFAFLCLRSPPVSAPFVRETYRTKGALAVHRTYGRASKDQWGV